MSLVLVSMCVYIIIMCVYQKGTRNPIYLVVVMDFLKTNDASTDENLGKLVDPRHYSFVIVSMVDLPIL